MKTKIKLLCPDEVWQPKRGARPGNRNAWKTGVHNARMRDLRSRIHAFKAYAREAMARADVRAREKAEALRQTTKRVSALFRRFSRGDAEFAEKMLSSAFSATPREILQEHARLHPSGPPGGKCLTPGTP